MKHSCRETCVCETSEAPQKMLEVAAAALVMVSPPAAVLHVAAPALVMVNPPEAVDQVAAPALVRVSAPEVVLQVEAAPAVMVTAAPVATRLSALAEAPAQETAPVGSAQSPVIEPNSTAPVPAAPAIDLFAASVTLVEDRKSVV